MQRPGACRELEGLRVRAHAAHAAPAARQVVAQKMAKLQPRGSHVHRPLAEVLIKRKKRPQRGPEPTWEVVRARGHLDEVQELRKGGTKLVGEWGRRAGRACAGAGEGKKRVWLRGRMGRGMQDVGQAPCAGAGSWCPTTQPVCFLLDKGRQHAVVPGE